ncbi:hypothetical protein AABB24_009017 [Solanum stoloniferum]|uniref:Uncharacterized protein n=1 Tax=Solanum stoloniferum TaxID=62892 RepID=A0ABD2UK55_9SOLN
MYPPSSSMISLVLLVLMIIIVVPLHSIQFSMAIRIFPTNPVALAETNFTSTKINQTEIFQKYFHDIIVNNNNNNNNGTRNGTALLHDNKRRVPSCPDPLHNK